MDPDFFRDKKKADLVDIVRMTKIMPVSHAQRMRKAELIDFLEKAHAEQRLGDATDETEQKQTKKPKKSAKKKKSTKSKKDEKATAKEEATSPKDNKEAKDKASTKDDQSSKDEAVLDLSEDSTKQEEKSKEKRSQKDERESSNEREDDRESSAKAYEPAPRRPRTRRRRRVSTSPLNQATQMNQEDFEAEEHSVRSGRQYTVKPRPRRSRIYQDDMGDDNTNTSAGNREASQDSSDRNSRDAKYQGDPVHGILEILQDDYGFIRKKNYVQGDDDVYVQPQMIRRFNLRDGDEIEGFARDQNNQERYQALTYITTVNGLEPEKMRNRPQFSALTPIYPNERYTLETDRMALSGRMIDLISPIGKGQRGMIVSPPKAGKTVMMQQIANAVTQNNPDAHLMVLLIDERPEEVTDMERRIDGEVISSTFDKTPENHVKIAELVLERAKRLVELGKDVFILMDSITRLARAYNLTITPTGRTLTGGLDPGALHGPKRFFGAARNIENGGSLTIIATALIDTGSRMDEVIFEEFKGTGNMEVHLDRKLADKRVYPAIDVQKSSTRREDLLLTEPQLQAVWTLRKSLASLDPGSATEMALSLLKKTKSNDHFVMTLNLQKTDKAVIDALR